MNTRTHGSITRKSSSIHRKCWEGKNGESDQWQLAEPTDQMDSPSALQTINPSVHQEEVISDQWQLTEPTDQMDSPQPFKPSNHQSFSP